MYTMRIKQSEDKHPVMKDGKGQWTATNFQLYA